MSYTMPQPPFNSPPNEEQFSAVPGDSTLEANCMYNQTEARFSLAQTALQPNVPPRGSEANTTALCNYIQPRGTTEHFTIQNFIEDHRKRTVGHQVRPVCAYCNKDFGRVQELNRHMKEKHMPWRQCPFCDFRWTRPDGIKAHLVARHAKKFTAEMLAGIKTLRGRRFVEFVDAYDHGLDQELGGNIAVTSLSLPEPLPAVGVLQSFHQASPINAGVIYERPIVKPTSSSCLRVNTPAGAARCSFSQRSPSPMDPRIALVPVRYDLPYRDFAP